MTCTTHIHNDTKKHITARSSCCVLFLLFVKEDLIWAYGTSSWGSYLFIISLLILLVFCVSCCVLTSDDKTFSSIRPYPSGLNFLLWNENLRLSPFPYLSVSVELNNIVIYDNVNDDGVLLNVIIIWDYWWWWLVILDSWYPLYIIIMIGNRLF